MRASHCKRSAALGTTLIAATIAFGPVGLPQASAATPSGKHISATTMVQRDNPYRNGYRAGYRAGYADARDDCRKSGGNNLNNNNNNNNNAYASGYSAGYDSGFASAEDRYCGD